MHVKFRVHADLVCIVVGYYYSNKTYSLLYFSLLKTFFIFSLARKNVLDQIQELSLAFCYVQVSNATSDFILYLDL